MHFDTLAKTICRNMIWHSTALSCPAFSWGRVNRTVLVVSCWATAAGWMCLTLQPVCKKTAHSEVSILLFFKIHLAVPPVSESHLLCTSPCLLPEGIQHRSSSESLYWEDLCNRSDMLQASRWELPADATFYSFLYLEIKDILETGRGIN